MKNSNSYPIPLLSRSNHFQFVNFLGMYFHIFHYVLLLFLGLWILDINILHTSKVNYLSYIPTPVPPNIIISGRDLCSSSNTNSKTLAQTNSQFIFLTEYEVQGSLGDSQDAISNPRSFYLSCFPRFPSIASSCLQNGPPMSSIAVLLLVRKSWKGKGHTVCVSFKEFSQTSYTAASIKIP